MSSTKTVRLYGDTHSQLKDVKEDGETFDEALRRILPEDVEVVEHPEQEVVGVAVSSETHDKVMTMAGQNVTADEVVNYYIHMHRRTEGYDE